MARHHYVMKSHLDKFVHPTSTRKILYPYQRRKGLILNKGNVPGPKKLGWAEDFYSQKLESGSITYSLDYAIQSQEAVLFSSGKGDAGALSKCIFDSDFFPCKHEHREAITVCAASTRMRAPVQIHNIAMIYDLIVNIAPIHYFGTEQGIESLADLLHITKDEARKQADEWKKHLLSGDLRIGVEEGKEKQSGLESLVLLEKLSIIDKMRWRLIDTPPNLFFITSDNPVVFEDMEQPNKRWHGVKQSKTVTVEVWYPLSHNVGLLMDWRKEKPQGRCTANRSLVYSLNRRMIKWCYKHIYSPLNEEWIGNAMKDNRFNPLLDRFTSLDDIIQSSDGSVIDTIGPLHNGVPYDVFSGIIMH